MYLFKEVALPDFSVCLIYNLNIWDCIFFWRNPLQIWCRNSLLWRCMPNPAQSWDRAQRASMASCQIQSHVSFHSSHTTRPINQGVMKLNMGKLNRSHEIIAFKASLHETKHVLIPFSLPITSLRKFSIPDHRSSILECICCDFSWRVSNTYFI